MDIHHRNALRAAARVREQLLRRRCIQGDIDLPASVLARADARLRQRDRARNLGWLRAAASLADDLASDLNYLHRQVENVLDVLHKQAQLQPIASQAELYRDILALDREFKDVEIDLKQGHLSVVTDEVVLDDVPLGPFEIQLELDHLGETPCYRVIAQNPNPAASDSGITHPHVQDEHICEGDGHQAIQMALTEGRLLDFFLMVSRLLATYSAGRAYADLSRWSGLSCSDCGDNVRESHAASCSNCDAWLCDDCRSYCQDCQLGFCQECLAICAGCGHACCGCCLSICQGCRAKVCSQCLVGNQCPTCRKNQPSNPKGRHDSATPVSSEPVAA